MVYILQHSNGIQTYVPNTGMHIHNVHTSIRYVRVRMRGQCAVHAHYARCQVELQWNLVSRLELEWYQNGSKLPRIEVEWNYNGIEMEVISTVEVYWNQDGIRMELPFQNGIRIEGSGPYKPPYYGIRDVSEYVIFQ